VPRIESLALVPSPVLTAAESLPGPGPVQPYAQVGRQPGRLSPELDGEIAKRTGVA
jgi:hypothetical protein